VVKDPMNESHHPYHFFEDPTMLLAHFLMLRRVFVELKKFFFIGELVTSY
jgi:hypothetical protein